MIPLPRTRWLVAACATAAVTALALPAVSGAAGGNQVAAAPGTASAEMFAAMQRDLGLTAEQVTARLAAEERASRIDRTVSAELGATFAGSWYDRQRERLVVATTDAAGAERARTLGADAVVVERSAAQLDAVMRRLDQLAGSAAPGSLSDTRMLPSPPLVVPPATALRSSTATRNPASAQ